MRIILIIALAFYWQTTFCQSLKTYSGTYKDGKAQYTYMDAKNGERIFQGNFYFKKTTYNGIIEISGSYLNDNKNGLWKYHFVTTNRFSAFLEELNSVTYKNGELNGITTFESVKEKLTSTKTLYDTKIHEKQPTTILSFKDNHLNGQFHIDTNEFDVTGGFDNDGFSDGDWVSKNKKYNGQTVNRYAHGILEKTTIVNNETGDINVSYDNSKLIQNFFQIYQKDSGIVKIEDDNYIIKQVDYLRNDFIDKYINIWRETSNWIFIINRGIVPFETYPFREIIIVNP